MFHDDGVYALLFVTNHCVACVESKKKFKALDRSTYPGTHFFQVDAQENCSLAERCSVQTVPAVRLVRIEDGLLAEVTAPAGQFEGLPGVGERTLRQRLGRVINVKSNGG